MDGYPGNGLHGTQTAVICWYYIESAIAQFACRQAAAAAAVAAAAAGAMCKSYWCHQAAAIKVDAYILLYETRLLLLLLVNHIGQHNTRLLPYVLNIVLDIAWLLL